MIPVTVMAKATTTSKIKGIIDTSLTRTFGTWVNGERFCILTYLQDLAEQLDHDDLSQRAPAYERKPRHQTVQRRRDSGHALENRQVHHRGGEHTRQFIAHVTDAQPAGQSDWHAKRREDNRGADHGEWHVTGRPPQPTNRGGQYGIDARLSFLRLHLQYCDNSINSGYLEASIERDAAQRAAFNRL